MSTDLPDTLLGRLTGRRLTAVAFAMDTVELWFDGDANSHRNVVLQCAVYPTVTLLGSEFVENSVGYGDALRRLVPEEVVSTHESTGAGVQIFLRSGHISLHPSAEELNGPEIAMLSGFSDGGWEVWRPGEESFEYLA